MASNHYLDLKTSLATGNVAAFVGAGLSIGAGLPSWYSLIKELANRIQAEMPPPNWVTGDALIDIAQTYVNKMGAHNLVMFLADRLDSTGILPSPAHLALARLPISLVFTANYDDLLEQAYRQTDKQVRVVVKDRAIAFMKRDPKLVNIVKLYGTLDQPETIVLAREQYESYFLQRPQIIKLLETELGRSTMLYLGWSHSDPHFNLVFGEILARYGDFTRMGFAAMFDVPDWQQLDLERKNIRIVELPEQADRTLQLATWLENLGSSSQ